MLSQNKVIIVIVSICTWITSFFHLCHTGEPLCTWLGMKLLHPGFITVCTAVTNFVAWVWGVRLKIKVHTKSRNSVVDPGVNEWSVLSRHIAYERSSARYYAVFGLLHISAGQSPNGPTHRARESVELLKVETPDFIPPNLWPSNSPDLNSVDYKIWGILQERVYKTSSKDVDELWGLRTGTSLTSA